MTKEQAFALGMAAMASVFNRALDPTAIRAYEIALEDLTAAEIAVATRQALKTCRFMPAPAELRALGNPPRNMALDAAEAWEAVRAAMDRHDYTTAVDFGPLVNAVVRNMGGWTWLCGVTTHGLTFERKNFERLYAEFSVVPPGSLRGEPLPGAFAGAPPVRIAIAGKLPPLQLAAPPNPVRQVVRELADAKAADAPAPGQSLIPERPPELRRVKAAPITADEKAAAVARMEAALAARAAVQPSAAAPEAT